ncbi:MAG: hypothetical protein OXR82_16315 [Gammaproteobacteria bacterium]|nr:hypothetical protein [Gammaproteobacteria bacterium]
MTDEAKRVLHAFRDGRRFSIGMVREATVGAPGHARVVLEQLIQSGYTVRAPVGPADLYRLTLKGRDLGQHLADTASAHTGISGRIPPSFEGQRAVSGNRA